MEELASALTGGRIRLEAGESSCWEQLLLSHPDGSEIALLERNAVENGSLGAAEIGEFLREIADCEPASAATWLTDYLRRVRMIYAFQVLDGTEKPHGWEILGALKSIIWKKVGGIFQADGEGFSNDQGYHILWQFSDNVKGSWWMGILKDNGWVHFQMELGDTKQREAFLRGDVPQGARLA
jgi:hypothetical protein